MNSFDVLFNNIIAQTRAAFDGMEARVWAYDAVRPWPAAEGALSFGAAAPALEIGGSVRRGVNYLCATGDETAAVGDEILLYGPDLGELRGEAPYGRITLVKLAGSELEERQLFNAMMDTDVMKHRVSPEGFTVAYAEGGRYEIAKISRAALDRGVSFANIGASYIQRYKSAPHVVAVTQIFVTDPAFDYAAAEALGARVQKAMMALRAHSSLPRRPEPKA